MDIGTPLSVLPIDPINQTSTGNFYKSYPADAEDGLSSIAKSIANQPGILEWLHELDDRCFKNIMHLQFQKRMCQIVT